MPLAAAYHACKMKMSIGGGTLMPFARIRNPQALHVCDGDLASGTMSRLIRSRFNTNARSVLSLLLATTVIVGFPLLARAQELPDAPGSSRTVARTTPVQLNTTYVSPSQETKINNYVFDTFGPYPIVRAELAAGIGQLSNAPPEWNQGVKGYAKRFGSDFGIAAVSTTTRYGLAQAFKEDTMYYRCECRGFLPRLGHAMISTLTSRRGEDGRRVFSVPELVAPYAGSMTATYGWFPDRYGAKDAFRTGNYNILTSMGGNIALEFFYSGPHSLVHRMHLNSAHGSTIQGPN
jgi:hypothetical protein